MQKQCEAQMHHGGISTLQDRAEIIFDLLGEMHNLDIF